MKTLNSLQKLSKLNSKISIYIPSTNNVDNYYDNYQIVDNTLSFLSRLFGGATNNAVEGSYLTSKGKLIKEKINIIYSYCTFNQLEHNQKKILEFCENLKNELSQESIVLEINQEMYFI